MRVLLSEGSGLTSRQTAQRLGELGHHVELLSSTQLCLSRFTRHVRAVHRVPQFGADPLGWLDAALEIARQRKVDLLFPTQEQVTVLSAQEKRLTVATIVPPFAALRRVQDKLSAFRTLAEIGASQPETVELFAEADLSDISSFPVFLKQPISTASSGVRKVANPAELRAAARGLGLGDRPLIAQSQVAGALAMVQAVADRGRLIGFHANLRVKEGVGGGAAIKRSTTIPGLADLLERIVARLRWRGGLSLDIILGAGGPSSSTSTLASSNPPTRCSRASISWARCSTLQRAINRACFRRAATASSAISCCFRSSAPPIIRELDGRSCASARRRCSRAAPIAGRARN